MIKHYAAALVAAMAMSATAQAQVVDQKVRVVETYGNALGDYAGNSARLVTYYNAQGRAIAEVNYKANMSGIFAPESYKRIDYNADGKVAMEWSQSYGTGLAGREEWQASKDTIVYTYDANGNLSVEDNQKDGCRYVYEYDAEGNMTKKSKMLPDYYDQYEGDYYEMQSETYSDFAAPNCPQKIVGDGMYESYKFSATAKYDATGNMIEKTTYNVNDAPTLVERWAYTGTRLERYESFSIKVVDGEQVETPKRKTLYTVQSREPLRIEKSDSTYTVYPDTAEWAEASLPTVTEYFNSDPATAPQLSVTKSETMRNTVLLTFGATKIDGVQNVAYDIFRNGIKIARVNASEAQGGVVTYSDEAVFNGSYDYFVQAVDADADKVEADPMNSYGHGMNTSDRVNVTFDTQLPAPTRVRVTSVEYVMGECFVNIGWDEPAAKDDYFFESYNIYYDGSRVPINSTATSAGFTISPITENSYRLSLGSGNAASNLSESVYVEAVYTIGTVTTAPVTVTNKTYDMSTMKERVSELWGDVLGEVSNDRITTKTVNYYNADGQLSATVRYGANKMSGECAPSNYTGVVFGEDGKPLKSFHQQYGMYDGLNSAWAAANDTVDYYYDGEGRLICEHSSHSTDSIVYTYDDQGRKTSETRYVPDAYGNHGGEPYVMEQEKYSDFNEAGLPQTITGDGEYDSYKFTAKAKYDAQGNMIEKETYNVYDVLTQKEYWTYELGVLSLYELNKVKNVQGSGDEMTYDETPSKKTVYTIVGSEPLRVKEENYDYMYGSWSSGVSFLVKEYFTPSQATAPELAVEPVAGAKGSYKLTFDAARISGAAAVVYDVFRHGARIARLSADEAVGGKLTYTDEKVPNGSYDYFVQAVDGEAAGVGYGIDTYGHGMNISNRVRVDAHVDVPAVTNLRVAAIEYSLGECFATITWDEPADKDDYAFQYYNVFSIDGKSPLNVAMSQYNEPVDDPILTNSYRFSLGTGNAASDLSETVYVQAVYAFGKANCDPIVVSNHDPAAGISGVEGGSCIRLSGSTITAGEGAVFDVYTVGGTAVATGCKGSLSLDGRSAGVYIVKVNSRGNVSTQKVVLRAND